MKEMPEEKRKNQRKGEQKKKHFQSCTFSFF